MITSDRPSAEADGSNKTFGKVLKEFGRHLDRLADQIAHSQAEADRDCASVSESLHDLLLAKTAIENLDCPAPAHSQLEHSCRRIDAAVGTVVVAMQYNDRLAQRLGLVRAGLTRLRSLLESGNELSGDSLLVALRLVEQLDAHEQKRLGPAAANAQSQSSIELF